MQKLLAEFVGTFVLVFGGCGSAVYAAGVDGVGIGWVGVSLAFGLTVMTMAYAVGPISGGHFNPAVTLGLTVAGKFDTSDLPGYWGAQVAGAFAAALVLWIILAGQAGFEGVGGFASNGYGSASPQGYGFLSVLLIEVILTALFLIIILGATSANTAPGFAPISIGLGLTLIHLISIPVSNTSVNPARSTGVAIFADGPALLQLWMFWVAPLIGAALGAIIWKVLSSGETPSEA
ncbi:MAG: aquaporin Z [Pseudomonadota bacterium]